MHIKDEKDIDIIIVGSGPGGATVAKELSQSKKKVCILEWGDNDPLTGSFWYGARSLLVPGKSMLFTSQLLGMVRGITTGGSTVHFYATYYPVPIEMLKSHGIDVSNEVEEMRNELSPSKTGESKVDINEVIQHILSETYIEANNDLQNYVQRLKFLNDMKIQIREELAKTRKTMEDYITSIEERLSTIGEDAQLANIDLQNMLQKQQQTIQMLSNISKMLHDTALAVIRNIR